MFVVCPVSLSSRAGPGRARPGRAQSSLLITSTSSRVAQFTPPPHGFRPSRHEATGFKTGNPLSSGGAFGSSHHVPAQLIPENHDDIARIQSFTSRVSHPEFPSSC